MDIVLFGGKNALLELYYGKIKKDVSNENYSTLDEVILTNNLTKLKKETYFNIIRLVKSSFSKQVNIYYSHVNESILTQIISVINKNISKVKVDTVEIKIGQDDGNKEENSDTKIRTIINGFRCFISGLYPETLRNSGTKHIYIDKKNISTLDKENIMLEQNINSSLMGSEPYEGDWGVIGHIQVQSKELTFKMGDNTHQGHIRILNYSNYSNEILKDIQGDLNDTFIVLNITTPQDYKKFDEDIKKCFQSYTLRIGDVLYSIRDECKWREPNYCSFLDTTRVYLGENNELWDQPVCYLNDSIINKKREFQREYINRKCKYCEKNSVCAKCMIVDDKHVNLYCNIKINNPYVTSYLFYRNIIKSFIFSYIKQVELVKPDEIIYLIPQKDLTSFGFEFRSERFIYDNFRNIFYKMKV